MAVKTQGATVLPLPAAGGNVFIDAETARDRFFAEYKVRGNIPTVRWVKTFLREIEVRRGPRKSGYWTDDITAFLKAR